MKVNEIEVGNIDATQIDENNSQQKKVKLTSQGTLSYPESRIIDDIQIKQGDSSLTGVFQNIVKCCIGSGIIALPYTFYQTGWPTAIVSFIILTLLINYIYIMINKIKEAYKRPIVFSQMVQFTLGQTQANIFITIVAIGAFSGPISYLLFFYQFFENVFYDSLDPELIHKLIYASCALLIIIPITFLNNFSFLSHLSGLANILIVFSLCVVLGYACNNLADSNYVYIEAPSAGIRYKDISLIIGVALFAYLDPSQIPTLQNSMKEPTKFVKQRIFQISLAVVASLYIVFPAIVQAGFSQNPQEIILFSLPKGQILPSVVQIIYSIALAITFPVLLLTSFQQIETSNCVLAILKPEEDGYFLRRTIIRDIQVLIIIIVSIFIPGFTTFLSIFGTFAFIWQGNIYPMILYYKKLQGEQEIWQIAIFWILETICLGLSIFVLVITIIDMIENY